MANTDSTDFNARIINEFRSNHGRVALFADNVVVLVHHIGRSTGRERVTPLIAQPLERGWAIFAAAAGAPKNPSWYHNLIANPVTTIEIGDDTIDVVAREAQGVERDRIWAEQRRMSPVVDQYEAQAAPRQIPVVILGPLD